jgi:hypothetical protein
MSHNPPMLGFENFSPRTVAWKDGTVCGILNLPPPDPEIDARIEAERIRNEHIRQSENVVLLEDWRRR